MKTTINFFVTMLITASNFSFSQSNEPDGRTYSVRLMTLKEGVNPIEFENYAKEQLDSAFRNVPGIEARVAKADRGTDKGIYLLIYFHDSKATRDYYFPVADAKELSKAAQEIMPHVEKTLMSLYEFVEQDMMTSEHTDYVFIE